MHQVFRALGGDGLRAFSRALNRECGSAGEAVRGVPPPGSSRPFRYGGAMLLVALVFFVRLELQPVLETRAPFLLFTFSVMVSAWYGGLGPGLLATFLGTAAGFYFYRVPDAAWLDADRVDWLLIVLSVFAGVAISILSGSMHSARANAEEAAQALRQSEERYRRIVETANEGIWLTDQNGRTTFVNESMANMLGYSPEEITGRPLTEFAFSEDGADTLALIEQRKKGVGDKIDFRLKRSDGLELWALVSVSPMFGDHGEFMGALAMVSDITERKKIEREREAMRVREQAARAREHIMKAEAARKSQEFKSAILDAVAHDMKTPLTSIKAAVTCLLGNSSGRPREATELLSVINEETDHLNRLVTEVIEAASVEVGRLRLQRGPYYLRETISAALEELKPKAAGRKVQLKLAEATGPADIDFQMVKQVFKQLLDNAIKYSPDGSPLTIACRPSGDRIVIEVADKGPGIPEEEQSRIFEEFYRASGRREQTPGTGMGLFIAKRIVDAHGGEIWVTSKPGCGSTFHVALPIYGRNLS